MSLTKEQQTKINEWRLLVDELAEAKAVEMKARKEICEELFQDAKLGTNHLDLGHGFKLTFTKKVSIKVDEAALASMSFPEGLLDKTIIYKPSYSTTGYKGLSDKYQKMLDEALIEKPASPTLAFVAPKEKK